MAPPEGHPAAVELLAGPTVVVGNDRRAVHRPREQAVIARLALAAPRPVPVSVLVEDVWGHAPPDSAVDALRVHVSNLRKLLADAARAPGQLLVTVRGGYRLAEDVRTDVARLDAAVEARDLPALRQLVDAPPWTGLAELDTGSGEFTAAARRIEERWVSAVELVASDDLATGRADLAVAALERVTAAHPHRENAWSTLVLALTVEGRRTEALRACQTARQHLRDAGIDPSPGLVQAEQRALRGDEAAPAPMAETAMETGYVDVEGAQVAFAVMGNGESDLLFVHGGFVPFSIMRDEPRLAAFLDRLARSFRVIVLDRRGIGMSDPPADGGPVTVEHWADDLVAVLDATEADQPLVYAHENAGPPALHLAASAPSRLRGLVLHSTVARYLRGPDYSFGPDQDVYERIDRLLAREWSEEEMLNSVAPSVGRDEALLQWLERAGRLGAGPRRAAELHRMWLEVDVRHLLHRVTVPAIVLQPARRPRADPGHARYLAEHLPDAELELLDSADHLPFLADASSVVDAIERLHRRTVDEPTSYEPAADRVLCAILAVGAVHTTSVELRRAGARSVVEIDGALVSTFRSRREADDVARRFVADGTPVVVEMDDTTGTEDDVVLQRVARRLT